MRRPTLLTLVIATMLATGCTADAAETHDTPAATPPPSRVPGLLTIPADAAETHDTPPTITLRSPAATPSRVPGSLAITADGTYAVPSQAIPGTYRTVVPASEYGTACYWARRGPGDTLIASDTALPGAQVTVTVEPTDTYFQTARCGRWVKVG